MSFKIVSIINFIFQVHLQSCLDDKLWIFDIKQDRLTRLCKEAILN